MDGASQAELSARAASRAISATSRAVLIKLICVLALALVSGACAATARNPDAGRPRAAEPSYVTLAADKDRSDRALTSWATLAHDAGLAVPPPAPELQPVTATVRAIPPEAVNHLRLPLVEIKGAGKDSQPTKENMDEATRESLRRFITSARDLLGVSLDELSLVEIRDEGTARVAVYQQRPFRRPLRNGYGRVEIRFAPDRSVLAISSTAIPSSEALRREFAQLLPRVQTEDQVGTQIKGRSFTYTNDAGASQTYTVAANDTVKVLDRVIYPVAHAGDASALDLHVAWETSVSGLSDTLVYVDAITGEIIAATRRSAAQNTAS